MPLQNIQTGRMVQPYGGDPADKITSGLAGLGAAMLQVGQFMQQQAVREQQMAQNYEMQLRAAEAKRQNDDLAAERDRVKLELDMLTREKAIFESQQRQVGQAETEMVRNAEFLPGMTIDEVNDEFNKVQSIVLGAQFRSGSDVMDQLLQLTMADKLKAFKTANPNAEDDELKNGALALARDHMQQLQLAKAERRGFGRALPLISPIAGEYLSNRPGSAPEMAAGVMGPPAPAPRPAPIPGLPQEFFATAPPADPQNLSKYYAMVKQAVSPMIRRDPDAAMAWWGQFITYYNSVKPGGMDLSMADLAK